MTGHYESKLSLEGLILYLSDALIHFVFTLVGGILTYFDVIIYSQIFESCLFHF